jgi:O-antigen ligase
LLFLRPWEMGIDNPLLLALPRGVGMLCFLSWLIHPGQHAKPNVRALHLLNLVLVYSAWLFLTTFMTPHVVDTQVDWLSNYFKSLVVFVMCLFFIDNERSVSEFNWTLVISALTLMVVRLYEVHTVGPGLVRLEMAGLFGNSNDVAAVIVLALPFALVPAFRKAAHLGQQALGILFAGVSALVIWYSQSRGAMLALAAQILTAGYLKTKAKNRLSMLLLAGLLGAAYIAAVKAIPREQEEMQTTSETRIAYWKAAVHMTLHHPVFGVGYGQFRENVWQHQTAHSSWFLAFAESGFPGGILFAAFFVTVLRTAWRNRIQRPDQFYALAGYGVAMTFLSHTYLMYVYLLAGLVLASNSIQERSQDGS